MIHRRTRLTLFLTLLVWVLAGRASGAESPNAWPKLTDAQQKAAIAQLKDYAQQTQTQLQIPLRSFETEYFLFCTDLSEREANQWAGLLDRMYGRLAEMFAVPAGKNIWRGKAMIFIFSRREDYVRYEKEMAHTDPAKTAGMCHGFSDGTVKVAFYRQSDELEFAHILVHESTHGFVHRYRSPVPIPSWANEGLAETVAGELVPQKGRRETVMANAREQIQAHQGSLGEFFQTDHIEGWQYPVAEMLCTFMIQASAPNYVAFINGIKDGMTADQSLTQRFQAPRERLVAVFGQWLGVRGLKD
ncbi:MAG TPA: hypothetical protein VK797_06815 [Tepidisphaeraceae bacterium]|nr:hypothetical protein [Tepidisphaeraceae bacterium]